MSFCCRHPGNSGSSDDDVVVPLRPLTNSLLDLHMKIFVGHKTRSVSSGTIEEGVDQVNNLPFK